LPESQAEFGARLANPGPGETDMAKRNIPAGLSTEEMRVLEKLVESGTLIAVPPKRMGKPRPVISASLTPGGKSILLYLSQEPADLDE
jgi:hypothetical protein